MEAAGERSSGSNRVRNLKSNKLYSTYLIIYYLLGTSFIIYKINKLHYFEEKTLQMFFFLF